MNFKELSEDLNVRALVEKSIWIKPTWSKTDGNLVSARDHIP